MPIDQLSRTFGALADPTRRAILARLAGGEATVGQLAEPFDMTFAAVSKHLRVLQDAGLVTRGRDAQYRPARLDARPLAAASGWITDFARFWGDSLDALGTYLADLQRADTTPTGTTPTDTELTDAVPADTAPAHPEHTDTPPADEAHPDRGDRS